jgi:YD repeat-containing protein
MLPAGSTLPGNARRVSIEWHSTWRVETRIAEPRRLTTKIYNGQFDPITGTTASCAEGGTLPDYSPIVVLCKQVEQATLDSNGSEGFSAALASASDAPIRIQQWTYNQHGQMLTAKDARSNTTTYSYHASTGADYTVGDLASVTNAMNQTTRFTKYNKSGQWLEMVDANGVTTTRTFDLRQRLKSATTAGFTTSYDYWPTGLLKTVTLPDASAVNYGYDDAHRLTSVIDNLGNQVTYTLDHSGNRIGEEVKDPTGRLAKTLTRVPDALNRIQQVTGRE